MSGSVRAKPGPAPWRWLGRAADALDQAFSALRAQPLRTGLTLLGMIIGAFTVVALMALAEGLRAQIAQDLSQLGAGVFQVQKWPAIRLGGDRGRYNQRPNLTLAHAEAVARSCDQCARVGAEAWAPGT